VSAIEESASTSEVRPGAKYPSSLLSNMRIWKEPSYFEIIQEMKHAIQLILDLKYM
jgi:hypothetical protein